MCSRLFVIPFPGFYHQLKEASAVLQKTTQQVQNLSLMVAKPSQGTPLIRSPVQPSAPPGEPTRWSVHQTSSGCVIHAHPCEFYVFQSFRVKRRQYSYHKLHLRHWPSQIPTLKKMRWRLGWTFWGKNAPRRGTKAPSLLSTLRVGLLLALKSSCTYMVSDFCHVFIY